jgi:hypothetical protein
MTKEKKLEIVCLIIVIGFACAAIFHYMMGAYVNLGYPHNTFLFRPDDRFNDFFNPLKGSFDRDPYNPKRIHFIGGYFPFGYMVSFLFSLIQPWIISFGVFLIGFITYLCWYIMFYLYPNVSVKDSHRFLIVFSLAFMTYPVLFALDRANFDIVIFILLSLSIFFYQKNKFTLSVVLLSLTIAMKGYTAILLALFLLDRRYKELFLAAILVPALTIGSLILFKEGLWGELTKMLVSFQSASKIAFDMGSLIRFNSSFYVFLLYLLKPQIPKIASNPVFRLGYVLFAIAVVSFTLVTIVKRKYPLWRSLLLLTSLMILLPPSSGDYRLLMLYPPLMLYVNNKEKLMADRWITLVFGLLLIPKAYFVLQSDINIGVLINPLLLVTLFVCVLYSPGQPIIDD